jgi:hypothetical protein
MNTRQQARTAHVAQSAQISGFHLLAQEVRR